MPSAPTAALQKGRIGVGTLFGMFFFFSAMSLPPILLSFYTGKAEALKLIPRKESDNAATFGSALLLELFYRGQNQMSNIRQWPLTANCDAIFCSSILHRDGSEEAQFFPEVV